MKEIDAINHELEVREVQKQKHKERKVQRLGDYFEDTTIKEVIEGSFDALFDDLEGYYLRSRPEQSNTNSEFNFDTDTEVMNFDLDIGITAIIDTALAKLSLNEPNKHGIYDLGDDYPEYEAD